MSRITRRATLAMISLLVCATLIAVGPRAALPASPTRPEYNSLLHTDQLNAPLETPARAYAEPAPDLPSNFDAGVMDGEVLASALEQLDLELVPTPQIILPVAPKPRAARPARLPGLGPRMRGKLIVQTQRIDIYVGSGSFDPDELAQYVWKLESLLIENESGFYPTKLSRRISIGFYSKGSAPSAGTRGIAYTDSGRIEIFYSPREDISAAFTIAAHELAHQLQNERYGTAVHSRSDMILLEGQATWVSGVRWLKEYGVPSWRGRAFQLYSQGIPLTLTGAQRYGSDNAYEMWASFVSYIFKRYGMDTVDELYVSSRGRAVGSADYKGVTGKTLAELTTAWRAWVLSYEPPPPPTATPIPVPPTPTIKPLKPGR